MTEMINAFDMAQSQFDHVADLLNMDHEVAEMLRWPMRVPADLKQFSDGELVTLVFFGWPSC